MAVVVICDECWQVIGPADRLVDAGQEPHLCEGCAAEREGKRPVSARRHEWNDIGGAGGDTVFECVRCGRWTINWPWWLRWSRCRP